MQEAGKENLILVVGYKLKKRHNQGDQDLLPWMCMYLPEIITNKNKEIEEQGVKLWFYLVHLNTLSILLACKLVLFQNARLKSHTRDTCLGTLGRWVQAWGSALTTGLSCQQWVLGLPSTYSISGRASEISEIWEIIELQNGRGWKGVLKIV